MDPIKLFIPVLLLFIVLLVAWKIFIAHPAIIIFFLITVVILIQLTKSSDTR